MNVVSSANTIYEDKRLREGGGEWRGGGRGVMEFLMEIFGTVNMDWI